MYNSPSSLKPLLPYWINVTKDNLYHTITKEKIKLCQTNQNMLISALNVNLLTDPCTEYDVLTRLWTMKLIEKGFFLFQEGLIDAVNYLYIQQNFLIENSDA